MGITYIRYRIVPRPCSMPDRADKFRKAAADCLAIARTTTDPTIRITLLTMAQNWFNLANGTTVAGKNFKSILRDNDRQMDGH